MNELAIDPSILARLEKLGGKKLKQDLIQMYLDKRPDKVAGIRDGISTTDYDAIERFAHTLISSAGNLGGMLVSQLSAKLELAAMEKDLGQATSLFPELESAEESLAAYLKNEMEKS
ncbi:MAG: Hpt domain-containing protein [Candidatus Marinimicrobia bacterium]|nr:Hpt domain-containing protein [Candidatus Neomarinimicrobiota bacterium]